MNTGDMAIFGDAFLEDVALLVHLQELVLDVCLNSFTAVGIRAICTGFETKEFWNFETAGFHFKSTIGDAMRDSRIQRCLAARSDQTKFRNCWVPSPQSWFQTCPKCLVMVDSSGLSNSQPLA